MAILLGVDTGGTYTDAVLIRGEDEVIATAKSLTTRHDLAEGVGKAVQAVLAQSGVTPDQIALSSLSTTLATNALVEGQGARVCLVFIGFGAKDIARQGLDEALRGDPVISVAGGHSHAGTEAAPFDADALRYALAGLDGAVSGFAIASQFATRNPAHEIAARDIIRAETGAPVTCSHELSAKLGGPKRAMTAVLNARLIGMIDHLIGATESYLKTIGITAPMMVVRGDGALISAEMARERPIETILSGPAASIVGARWLTQETDALVSDIGGTTTDVAVLRDGRPMIDPQGAQVGGFRTMVEAVAMRTTGLGGDSEVHLERDGLSGGLTLGPRRVLPISLAAQQFPEVVKRALEQQITKERLSEYDGRFVVPIRHSGHAPGGLSEREARVLDRLGDQAWEMGKLLTNRMEASALTKLVSRGLVMISAVTPSDAAHVLGILDSWDGHAAHTALTLFARQRNGSGMRIAPDAETIARNIIDQVTQQTCETLLEAAFGEDETDFELPAAQLARHVLTRFGTQHYRGLVALDVGLNLPVIGLGASAHSYYGAVGERLSTRMILPEHAGVANAIGAVVGQVSMRKSGLITSAGENRYRVHFHDGPEDFTELDTALNALETHLSSAALADAKASGAEGIRVRTENTMRNASVEGRNVFVEAEITAIASGRPRIAG
ncbi:hydantoinase/oxoprolinase family protein [Roseobacter sp. N2S]|uniref:hydantoinase/oxoprolinase family protein n=1 Tax=Roseobacter sp. N2S TaxID=2663844 RepID=UPI002864D28E|nr:hydantoinase/oxoprolinase family protein [Roseobacter sp. N2S]MDR6264819.1 N-methylhydantoinase A/oxoprolinase/acetone carboxylase beta subunit [Roseobacter sp. N2S]